MIAWTAARMDPGRLRRAHRLPLPERHLDRRTGAGRGAHRPGRRHQRAVQPLGSVRLVGDPRQPAGAADRRGRTALRRADLPAGVGRAVPGVRAGDHGQQGPRRLRRGRAGTPSSRCWARPLPPPPDGGGGLPEDVAGLVAEAQRLYAEAQAALAAGDLGTYQDRLNELEPMLERLAELTGASPEAVAQRLALARWTSWSSAPGRASMRWPGAWRGTRGSARAHRARQRRHAGRGRDRSHDLDIA